MSEQTGLPEYYCPYCRRRLYRYQPVVPVVGNCGGCRRPVRLVGQVFVAWSKWLDIRRIRDLMGARAT